MERNYDFLVVGSGIAGLTFALKVAQAGRSVCILTKKDRAESNTNYAQGGIAAVTSEGDDFERHVTDTMQSGDGLCDEEVVRAIVSAAPERIKELAQLGVDFTRLEDGRHSLGKEGGHTKRRVLHVQDVTGKAIEKALLDGIAKQGVEVLEHFFVVDLITAEKLRSRGMTVPGQGDRLLGLYALNVKSAEVETFRCRSLVLATGGLGRVYQYTTNPTIATGDGVAMAYRAGVEVMNMEFVQFHPTTLYTKTDERFLITEAVRGEGAVLRDEFGKTFMERYHEQADLAPRDVVARAIDQEMKRSGAPHVWLDASPVGTDHFPNRFPHVHATCLRHGIDPRADFIPVVPAAHYLCGGVRTSIDSSTSLPGLFACGEVACTGLHGANRLASNSLLEAVVMADTGVAAALAYLSNAFEREIELPDWAEGDFSDSDERVVLSHNLDELKRTLWDYVGIVRTTKRLERARSRIGNLAREINEYYWYAKVDVTLLELRNLVQVADLIVDCALKRKESRGLHYTLDYPDKLEIAENVTASPVFPFQE
jgi:L-aspartate oxidase